MTKFRFIIQALSKVKIHIIAQIIIILCWAATTSVRPYLLKEIIDNIRVAKIGEAWIALKTPGLLYIGVAVSLLFIFRINNFIFMHMAPKIKVDVGEILMTRMMDHSVGLYKDHLSGGLSNKIRDAISGIPDLIKIFIENFIFIVFALVIATYTVYKVHPEFAMGLVCWEVIYIAIAYYFAAKTQKLSFEAAQQRSSLIGLITDIIGNIMSIIIFASKKTEQGKLTESLRSMAAKDKKRDYLILIGSTCQATSFVIYQSVCLFWLVRGFDAGYVTPGDFVLIFTLNIAIVDKLWCVSDEISRFADIKGNVWQGLSMAFSEIEVKNLPGAKNLKVGKGEICFDKVNFSYDDAEELFNDKSIIIEAGQKVGLVGYSGGGKTSFVNLILRLYDIQEGSITIDGQDIREVTLDSLHQAIGMIPQDTSLFHRSLMENIRYSKNGATDKEVFEAAKKAHCDIFIDKLPQKYESMVGERGIKLSGGQRQRIAIARAILKNAPILILDEATSQLDSVTESYIQESLQELMKDKTVIVIAHRLSTLLNMDRILVFDGGKIIQDGPHKQLLDEGGLYNKLWSAQVGGFIDDIDNESV